MAAKKVKTKIRQVQITDAALDIISKEGLSGLTIATLAARVGIADSNVYRHFKDKRAVMNTIIAAISANLEKIIKDTLAKKEPALKCLENIFFKHIGFLERHKGILRVIFSDEMYSKDKKLTVRLKGSARQYLKGIKNILRQGIISKALDKRLNTDVAAAVFLGLIQSTALQWLVFGNLSFNKPRCQRIWQIYLKGILAR
jgi:AcrR family transcriptional regulator